MPDPSAWIVRTCILLVAIPVQIVAMAVFEARELDWVILAALLTLGYMHISEPQPSDSTQPR